MANTFIKIASITVGSGGTAAIDFTSIPNTFTDLMLVHSMRGTNANAQSYIDLTFNNATTGYSNRAIFGNSATVQTYTYSALNRIWGGLYQGGSTTANVFGSGQIYIPNYANSTTVKSAILDSVSEANSVASDSVFTLINGGLWNSTAAITSVKITNELGNWAEHSTAILYGIKKD
jgi:hypothetical protein